MAHTTRDKQKLLDRVRRIRGQVEGIERALLDDRDCTDVLNTIAACRGAMNGLMAQLVEGHVRFHVLDPKRKPTAEQSEAAQDLIDIVKAYLR
jgi:DNA-binding FrmR family transcriptional regulator